MEYVNLSLGFYLNVSLGNSDYLNVIDNRNDGYDDYVVIWVYVYSRKM